MLSLLREAEFLQVYLDWNFIITCAWKKNLAWLVFISTLQLVHGNICGKFIGSKFLPWTFASSSYLLWFYVSFTKHDTLLKCWWPGICVMSDQIIQFSLSFSLSLNMEAVLMLLMNMLSSLIRKRIQVYFPPSLLSQAENEDCIIPGCLPMNAVRMHINMGFSPVHFSSLRCYC